MTFEEGVEFGAVRVEADADDFEAVAVVFFIGGNDVRELVHAGPAPCRPEIHEHDLALQCADRERLAGEVGFAEVGEREPGGKRGILKKMEEVEIVGIKDTVKTTVTDIEMFRKLLDSAEAGDNVGVLLRGIKKDDIERGQVIAKPGSIKPHKKFKAEVYVLSKDEGGRHTPFFTNYRPQFYFRTTDVTGNVKLPEGVEMVMPGDNVSIEVELITPIAMEKTIRFAIREGGRTVGAGRVADILD